jgi:hypothetical protein
MASAGIQVVLALEVSSRKTAFAEEHSATDCGDCNQQPDLGTGAGGRRAFPQAGNAGIAADSESLLAGQFGLRIEKSLHTALDDVCAKSRKCCCRMRFYHGGDSGFPYTVCTGADGARFAENPVLQRNRRPTAMWATQQFREAIPSDHRYRFLIHDRDSIFSEHVDETIENLGLHVLRTPVRAPQANAFCERLIGTIRRECLDFVIPLGEKDLRRILREWVLHYNQGRPNSSLGPGIPAREKTFFTPSNLSRHRLPQVTKVTAKKVLGGLHHEYRLERLAA